LLDLALKGTKELTAIQQSQLAQPLNKVAAN